MACSENAFKAFFKQENVGVFPSFEKCLIPHLLPHDVIEILGEAGSGKTELLYHFISTCILPFVWKGIQFGGLETEITLIDNDCHFNLLRLMTIMEQRVKVLIQESNNTYNKKEIFSFVQGTLKLLHVIKCYDSNEFILTLSSLESALCLKRKRSLIMIDGLSSFYLADKAVFQNNFTKLTSHYKIIVNLIEQISKKSTPVIATRRNFLNTAESDKKVFGHHWNATTTWRFHLRFKSSLPDKTILSILNTQNSTTKLCYISNSGIAILEEK